MLFKDSAIFHFFRKFGKYHITILIFLFILLYWDENNLIYRWSLDRRINQLENEIAHYEESIKESTQQLDQLKTDSLKLEKFARENYLMKKKEEDIFIIEEEKKK